MLYSLVIRSHLRCSAVRCENRKMTQKHLRAQKKLLRIICLLSVNSIHHNLSETFKDGKGCRFMRNEF